MNAVVTIKATPADLNLIVLALSSHRVAVNAKLTPILYGAERHKLQNELAAIDDLLKKLS